MSIFRPEPMKLRSWAPRAASLTWRLYDLQLTTYAVLLTIFGLAMAYSNSVGTTHTTLTPGSPFVRSLMWAVIAGVVFVITTMFDYRWLRTFAWPIYLVNVVLLILTLRFGASTGNAGTSARWIVIAGFQLQFSELAKILMIIVFAAYLASRQSHIKSVWTVIGAILVLGPPWILVMLQPDLGTSLVMVATLAGMLFMSGTSLKWLATLAGAVVAAVPIVWANLHPYQRARLLALLNPGQDPRGSGYQLLQSETAVNAGGAWGKGLTNGTVPLPVQTTDFVWGLLAEELGFFGSMVVLALFVALMWRLLVSAWRSNDTFALLLGCGLASMLLFQMFVNVGMVIGIMPITGIPLPFITYGGASLVSLMGGLGVMQSANLRREPPAW
ncbi:MAG: FtsW/RodA/SpoVE family cell cycle protein [Candidatus Limnocylindrales bacterium]|jgi:rod shape determining protein RodA